MKLSAIVAAAFLVSAGMTAPLHAQDKKEMTAKKGGGDMSFFVTSKGKATAPTLAGWRGRTRTATRLPRTPAPSARTGRRT